MRLVGLALLDELLRRELRRRVVRRRRGQRGKAPEQRLHLLLGRQVVEVADEERAAAGTGPAALAEGDDALAREAAQVLLGTEHGASERMRAECRTVDQVLGDHRRLVGG